MGVLEGEAFHRMGEVDDISAVEQDEGDIGNQEDGAEHDLVPFVFTEAEGEDGKKDEQAISPKDGHGVEKQAPFCYVEKLMDVIERAEQRLVNYIKGHFKEPHDEKNGKQPQEQCRYVVSRQAFPKGVMVVLSFVLHRLMMWDGMQKQEESLIWRKSAFVKAS